LGKDFLRKGRKGAEFRNSFVAFTIPLCMEKLDFSRILSPKCSKTIGSRDKMLFLQRDRIFFSAAEFFGQSGKIILKRVGNTAWRSLFEQLSPDL
jgi:hypothetical protein